MASSTHWRREVGKDSSLQYHMIYNPLTNTIDFTLFRFGSTWKDREVVSKFPLPFASVIHMFSVTENFAVIVVYPVSFDFRQCPAQSKMLTVTFRHPSVHSDLRFLSNFHINWTNVLLALSEAAP